MKLLLPQPGGPYSKYPLRYGIPGNIRNDSVYLSLNLRRHNKCS